MAELPWGSKEVGEDDPCDSPPPPQRASLKPDDSEGLSLTLVCFSQVSIVFLEMVESSVVEV